MTDLTIVAYHYIRPIIGSEFPGIKGLEVEGFKRQLDFLESNYSIVSSEQVIDKIIKNKELPPKACWLTFDDGYKDQIDNVLYELEKRKIKASFFPPVMTTIHNKVLDVNKIHFILDAEQDYRKLIVDIKNEWMKFDEKRTDFLFSKMVKKINISNRLDEPNVVLIKRLLQWAIDENERNIICNELFSKLVSNDEKLFSKELYMSLDDLKTLHSHGHEIGIHGCDHLWLGKESYNRQKNEILDAVNFFSNKGILNPDKWTMCYPYGSYNDDTIKILRDSNCIIGLTTLVSDINLNNFKPLEMPRFDTNDFPQ